MSNDPTWSQANHTLTLIAQQNPTSEHIRELHNGAITDLVQAIISGTIPSREEVREFYGLPAIQKDSPQGALVVARTAHKNILTVDYGLTLEQMIALGQYGADGDNWNRDITADRFPITGSGVVEFEFKVFETCSSVSSEEVIELIRSYDKIHPWEPAKTEHILAYGATYPEKQTRSPIIIGLGSSALVKDVHSVLRLRVDGPYYRLGLDKRDVTWIAHTYFLAVRVKCHPLAH